jgi:hypothetical protein
MYPSGLPTVVRLTRRPVTLPVPFDIVLTHGAVARPSTARPTEAVAPVPSSRERRRHRSLRPNRTDQTRLTRATRGAVRSPSCRGRSAPAARHRFRTRGLPTHLSGRRRLLIGPHPQRRAPTPQPHVLPTASPHAAGSAPPSNRPDPHQNPTTRCRRLRFSRPNGHVLTRPNRRVSAAHKRRPTRMVLAPALRARPCI